MHSMELFIRLNRNVSKRSSRDFSKRTIELFHKLDQTVQRVEWDCSTRSMKCSKG